MSGWDAGSKDYTQGLAMSAAVEQYPLIRNLRKGQRE